MSDPEVKYNVEETKMMLGDVIHTYLTENKLIKEIERKGGQVSTVKADNEKLKLFPFSIPVEFIYDGSKYNFDINERWLQPSIKSYSPSQLQSKASPSQEIYIFGPGTVEGNKASYYRVKVDSDEYDGSIEGLVKLIKRKWKAAPKEVSIVTSSTPSRGSEGTRVSASVNEEVTDEPSDEPSTEYFEYMRERHDDPEDPNVEVTSSPQSQRYMLGSTRSKKVAVMDPETMELLEDISDRQLLTISSTIDKLLEEEGGSVLIYDKTGKQVGSAETKKDALKQLKELAREKVTSYLAGPTTPQNEWVLVSFKKTADNLPMLEAELLKFVGELDPSKEDERKLIYDIKDLVTRGVKREDFDKMARVMTTKRAAKVFGSIAPKGETKSSKMYRKVKILSISDLDKIKKFMSKK